MLDLVSYKKQIRTLRGADPPVCTVRKSLQQTHSQPSMPETTAFQEEQTQPTFLGKFLIVPSLTSIFLLSPPFLI